MAYGRSYNRRRLGGSRGNYARTMGYVPVPFERKRKYPGSSTTTGGGAPPRLGRRVRPRMARSYTFTKTKTKRRPGKVTTHGDNQSSSVNVIGKRWMSQFDRMMYRKIVSPQSVFTNSSGNFSSTQGKQFVFSWFFMNKTDLVAMETAANGGVATNLPTKLFLKQGKFSLKIRNQSNTNAKISFYDLTTKRNTVSTALDAPVECWNKGLTDYGAPNANTVGFTPYKSPEFNQYFAVNKVTTVSLEPGQQHDHTVYHRYNRVVDSIQFQNNVGTALAGLTRFVLIVMHGTLGHESLTPGTVTYMPVLCDFAWTSEHTYGWIQKSTRAFTATDNNPAGVADFDFMGENGDVDANLVTS